MAALKPITIIGGGLAGLALGIGLRLRGIPVTVYEATHYPRHRVCGEFISGRGQQVLRELGLEDVLREAGAIPATTAMFRIHKTASPGTGASFSRDLYFPIQARCGARGAVKRAGWRVG